MSLALGSRIEAPYSSAGMVSQSPPYNCVAFSCRQVIVQTVCACTYIHVGAADVRTQADYQQLDTYFVGLIFSCFSETEKVSICELTCCDKSAFPEMQLASHLFPVSLHGRSKVRSNYYCLWSCHAMLL